MATSRIAAEADSSTALIFHYFGSKAGLYAAVIEARVETQREHLKASLETLPPNTSARDRVRTWLLLHLDQAAREHREQTALPLAGTEPEEALAVRSAARLADISALRETLGIGEWARHEYALWGFFGFIDAACLRWAEQGCPEGARYPIIDAALGALEGALGDWGS